MPVRADRCYQEVVPPLAPVPGRDGGATYSALVVPVPEADWLVNGDPGGGPRLPAHVTLLVPFAPRPALTDGVLAELAGLFADVVPFTFALDEVCTFPSGSVYLAPDPGAPFRLLTGELARRFPEYPPHQGHLDAMVPHVPIPMADADAVPRLRARLAEHGGLLGHASEAQLLWVEDERYEVLADFCFGFVAA
jgi:hypothetical protein